MNEQFEWRFSPMDLCVASMVNCGSWLFNSMLDTSLWKSSLKTVLQAYPLFVRTMGVEGMKQAPCEVPFVLQQRPDLSCSNLQPLWKLETSLKADLNLKTFKAGKCAALSVKVVQLSDGTLLSVSVAHLCADASSLYRFMSDWAKVYNGQPFVPPVFDQEVLPQTTHTRQQLMELLPQEGWHRVGWRVLLSFLIQKCKGIDRLPAKPLFISNQEIARLKAISPESLSTHSLLSALLIKKLGDKHPNVEYGPLTVVSTIDLRGKLGIPENFVGNAVVNISSQPFAETDVVTMAAHIQSDLRAVLDYPTRLFKHLQLYMEAMQEKVPFVSFNLQGVTGKHPRCIIINNFLKFAIYDICFGTVPIKVYPNDLPDTIRLWRARPDENGFYVLLKGNWAKLI